MMQPRQSSAEHTGVGKVQLSERVELPPFSEQRGRDSHEETQRHILPIPVVSLATGEMLVQLQIDDPIIEQVIQAKLNLQKMKSKHSAGLHDDYFRSGISFPFGMENYNIIALIFPKQPERYHALTCN